MAPPLRTRSSLSFVWKAPEAPLCWTSRDINGDRHESRQNKGLSSVCLGLLFWTPSVVNSSILGDIAWSSALNLLAGLLDMYAFAVHTNAYANDFEH